MDRRLFFRTLAGGLFAAPLVLHEQQTSKVYRIAFFTFGSGLPDPGATLSPSPPALQEEPNGCEDDPEQTDRERVAPVAHRASCPMDPWWDHLNFSGKFLDHHRRPRRSCPSVPRAP